MTIRIEFTAYGVLPSMKNSRPIAYRKTAKGPRPFLAPSKEMKRFKLEFATCVKPPPKPWICDVSLTARIFYVDNRRDLDGEYLCDLLQLFRIIKNDRQIKEKHYYHGIDKERPRVEISIEPLEG